MNACQECPEVVAVVRQPILARIPEAATLCITHLRALIQHGEKARTKPIYERCACGREMYLPGRTQCEGCRLATPIPPPAAPDWAPSCGTAATPPTRTPRPGLCALCDDPGDSFAGGRYCPTHLPTPEPWMLRNACGTTTPTPRVIPVEDPDIEVRITAAILIRDTFNATIVRTERTYGDS